MERGLLELGGELRKLAERLSTDVVLRRRLPRGLGGASIYVGPGKGGLRYWWPSLERTDPNLMRFAAAYVQQGMNVWDIGANLGLFAFAAAFRSGSGGHVLALEPDAETASLMFRTRRSLPVSGYAAVDILVAAASSGGQNVGWLSLATRARAANALVGFGSTQTGGELERRPTLLVTLDSLMGEFGKPDLVKIDVEGAELQVLQGAQHVLSEARPILHIEVSSAVSNGVGRLLRSCNYKLFDASSPDGIEVEEPTFNCLALPRA